ncbi:major facilitator superfamily domain-containing protein [Obelidium mucronatum]|nr:major facilitator superfamily domain-containing protein [Obelidium mucronatum]
MADESDPRFLIASTDPAAAFDITETDKLEDSNAPLIVLSRVEFILVFFGLFLAMLVVPLDTSITLGHQELLPWVGSAYTLAAAPVGIVFGKLVQVFGCKWTLVFALLIFEVGSLISAVSESMVLLIIGRVITGLGGGGMGTAINIIITEICSVNERGKYLGILGVAYGLAFLLGPVVGGILTDHISWRWCFYINIPIGVFAIIVCVAFLRYPPKSGPSIGSQLKQIDFLGATILFIAMICIDTPLQLGGNQWKWNSPQTIALFAVFLALAAAFVYLEMNVIKNPLVPREVFLNKTIVAFSLISFAIGAGMFSGVYYNALFFQVVFGDSAVKSGVRTYPMVLAFIMFSIVSGALFSRSGHYGLFFIVGPIIWAGGIILTAFLKSDSSSAQSIFAMLLMGIGVGCILQLRVSALQSTVPPELLSVGTGLTASVLYMGGTMAVSTTGAILDNLIRSKT